MYKIECSYIDFEIEIEEHDRVRSLYERLLERTKNVRVWTSFAQFECSIECADKAREVFTRGEKYFKVDADHESATEEVNFRFREFALL